MSNEEESQMTFSMLPDDLVLNCLARVSKVYYPSLSFVSKRFRSLLASTDLQNLRSFLGCSGSCLYVCLQLSYNTRTWFTLRQRPDSHSKILVQVSSPNSPFEYRSGVVAVDSNIYAIGGLHNKNALSKVMVMDCCTHTWHEAPSMRVARDSPSTCVVNGKIHVIGGCKNLDSTNWIEVFDTKTQTWEFLQIPSEVICRGSEYKSVGYDGTVYVSSMEKNVAYKMHKGRWREAHTMFNHVFYYSSSCVIENVLYRYSDEIRWFDSYAKRWRPLKGLPRSFMNIGNKPVKLVNYGGNIALLWEDYNHKKKLIIWAEIVIEKKHQGEIWGLLKCSDVVFITDDQRHVLVHALATNV